MDYDGNTDKTSSLAESHYIQFSQNEKEGTNRIRNVENVQMIGEMDW